MRQKAACRDVYFVQSEHGGPIKIGVANDAAQRLISMQVDAPDTLVLLGVVKCDRGGALEGELHRRFAAHRIRGEWFAPVADLMAYIEATADPGEWNLERTMRARCAVVSAISGEEVEFHPQMLEPRRPTHYVGGLR